MFRSFHPGKKKKKKSVRPPAGSSRQIPPAGGRQLPALPAPGPRGSQSSRAVCLRLRIRPLGGFHQVPATPGIPPSGHTRTPLPLNLLSRRLKPPHAGLRFGRSSRAGLNPPTQAFLGQSLGCSRKEPKAFGRFRRKREGGASRAAPGRVRLFP